NLSSLGVEFQFSRGFVSGDPRRECACHYYTAFDCSLTLGRPCCFHSLTLCCAFLVAALQDHQCIHQVCEALVKAVLRIHLSVVEGDQLYPEFNDFLKLTKRHSSRLPTDPVQVLDEQV